MWFETILTGLAAGVSYSLLAWGKKEGQAFEWSKFGTTLAIGGFVGVGVALLNLPADVLYTYAINLGLVPTIENVLKIIYRKIIKA